MSRRSGNSPQLPQRGLRGFVLGVPRGSPLKDLSPPGSRFFPRPARHPPGYRGRLLVSESHPAHLAELTARRRGTFFITPRAGAAPAQPRPPRLGTGARSCPPRPPGRSRASRRVPRATLPNGDGGGLRSGACRLGLCPAQPARGSPTPVLPVARAASKGPAGPYLVRRPQQPVDPGQLGAEREVLAEREQRRPAGLGEVGAVERVRVVQELHPASQRGHDASLLRGARAPGSEGPQAGTPGSL